MKEGAVMKKIAFWAAAALLICGSTIANANSSMLSEKIPAEHIRQAVVDYYQLSPAAGSKTYYSYNYVDLNADGTKEAFVVVCGPYTSGSGGDSGLLLAQDNGAWQIKNAFTLVRTPVMITDVMLNGYKNMLFTYYGGGAKPGYAAVFYKNGSYVNVNDGIMLDDTSFITGYDILADQLVDYTDSGFSLAPAEDYYLLQDTVLNENVHYPVVLDHPGELTRDYANQSLLLAAKKLQREDHEVSYTVTLNSKELLSVVYCTTDSSGATVLEPVNLEMKRAGELKTDTSFTDLKAVSVLTGIAADKLSQCKFYFLPDEIVFLEPAAGDVSGYNMVKVPLRDIKDFLKL